MYCIYQITNKINGHRYIGQHKYEDELNPMGKYKGSGLNLHRAYKKYGIESFEIEILYKRIRDKSTVDAMEIWAIEKYKPEYNIAKGGSGGDIYHALDDAGKNRMRHFGPENGFYGKHHSAEFKKKHSEWVKANQSGCNAYWYGKHLSEETKKKISEANKGNQYGKGKHHSEESKQKNRLAHLGKKLSEDTRKKKSESMKAYWARRKKLLELR